MWHPSWSQGCWTWMARQICRYAPAVWTSCQGDDTSFFGDVAISFQSIWHLSTKLNSSMWTHYCLSSCHVRKIVVWSTVDCHLYALCGYFSWREDVVYRYCRWASGFIYWLSSIVVFHGIIRKGVWSGLLIKKLVGNLKRKRSYFVGWVLLLEIVDCN